MITSNNELPADKMRPCDIRPLLQEIFNAYQPQALNKGLNFWLDIDDEVFERYEADNDMLTGVLSNLISNAINHTRQGAVELDVKCVSSDDVNDVLRFTVIDTGTGITEEQYKTLSKNLSGGFDNSDNSSGLSTVKSLLKHQNSELIFNSVEGRGSEFSFDLLLKRSAQIQKNAGSGSADIVVKTALLAEDNMVNALVAKKLLAKWDITTDHANNGAEAVAMAAQKVYDVILMDIHMPDVNGFQATKIIRTTENPNTKTRIYALTADITAKDQAEYAHYFDGFLNKPVEVDKLHKALTTGLV